jgi:2-dehydro-3-deoxygalactonokinase
VSGALVIGDWGGSRLRLWRIEGGRVADRREGPGVLASGNAAAALSATLGDWAPDRLVLGGMAGAREGLYPTAYVPCPVTLESWRSGATSRDLSAVRVRIAAGLSCRDASGRPDVLRGEEAQVFGAMKIDPTLATGAHTLLLPGTHSKWVRLKDGMIAGFQPCMTGELFALLGASSLLASAGVGEREGEDEGFAAGLARAADGAALPSSLFEARAAQLADGRTGGWARGFVSGLLIGGEVAEMAPRGKVVAIGEPELVARYDAAFAIRGLGMRAMDGEACAVAGLLQLDD